MGFGIMRVDKVKTGVDCGRVLDEMLRQSRGLATEEYTATHFRGSHIDVSRSAANLDWCVDELKDRPAGDTIRGMCEAVGARVRKDSVLGLTGLYALSPEVADAWTWEQKADFFKECVAFHQEHYGATVAVSLHMDEKTPHLHVFSVPLTDDGRLSAKDIMGNRKQYHERQQLFYDEVCRGRGLEPFQVKDKEHNRKHLSNLDFKIAQRQQEIVEQERKLSSVSLDISKALQEADDLTRNLDSLRAEVKHGYECLCVVEDQIEKAEDYIVSDPTIEERIRQSKELEELKRKARQYDKIRTQYPDIDKAIETISLDRYR